MRPSTTNSLRWSRWFGDQEPLAASGLSGLNSTTCTPACVSWSKKALPVSIAPTLS